MPPIPVTKFTDLLLTRRKLFEKIMQNVAARKIQNHITATGDRMSVTPQQFGMQVGKTMGKQAFLGPGLLGAGIGAATSPAGHRMEGASRGAVKATGTGLGAVAGIPAGILAAAMMLKGKRFPKNRGLPSWIQLAPDFHYAPGAKPKPRPVTMNQRNQENMARMVAAVGMGAPAGAAVGGGAGYAGASALLGKPSWEKKEASLLSTLGGVAGGGIGGLAGGAGGGILGALTGGALGGGPGAGIGLLAGGAAGLGAGAHLGSNIGASIGQKKKEKPESEEKEEKSEEKSEESGDEEVKESAARVLAQLQKNAK